MIKSTTLKKGALVKGVTLLDVHGGCSQVSRGIDADLKSALDVILAALAWSGVVAEFALFW